ncbi:response regulator [uncultured Methanoregula sp.]|uniref:response regulator n=1 Tax=uncultured Methanoregula sp. TaxID=1005933 RepID=UPI002AAB5B63|nr:response regulator [uncultured Methanoregula sp.]
MPDYNKILEVHLKYQDHGYSVSSVDVMYGNAPNLNLRSGNLKGVILDADGNILKSFSMPEPGIAYGDILGSTDSDSLIGYTERPAAGDMSITLPYVQGMKKFSLSNSRDGSVLVTADFGTPIGTFCTDYPNDPDCLVQVAPVKSAVPDSLVYLILATLLSASIIIAAALAILTIRQRNKVKVLEKPTVLIVDDNKDIVDMLQLLLDRKGYATRMAFGGAECLDIVKKQIPDLILLDVMMEPMDGWQTLEQIKKNPDTKSVPVLMLTAKRLTAAEAKQYKLCIDDYIVKPCSPATLYAAVEAVLERKKKLQESLSLAKKAGIDRDKVCEFATLTRRISVNKKILDVLHVPQAVPTAVDMDMLDSMSVADYISVKNRENEKRAEQLRREINSSFKSKGLPEFGW